jgi:hypothetical protein
MIGSSISSAIGAKDVVDDVSDVCSDHVGLWARRD